MSHLSNDKGGRICEVTSARVIKVPDADAPTVKVRQCRGIVALGRLALSAAVRQLRILGSKEEEND